MLIVVRFCESKPSLYSCHIIIAWQTVEALIPTKNTTIIEGNLSTDHNMRQYVQLYIFWGLILR